MFVTALVFFAILSFLVLVHELGHFFTARIIGVEVEEFGFGLPPRVIGKKIKGTLYSLNWLPIGGFVRLAGEDGETKPVNMKSASLKKYFWARSKKERSLILMAGVTMNFLIAVGITTVLLAGGIQEPSGRVHIVRVIENGPAHNAGILVDDVIKSIALPDATVPPTIIQKTSDIIDIVSVNKGTELSIQVLRGSETLTLLLTPRQVYPDGEGPTGIAISDLETHKYAWYKAPFIAFRINVERAVSMLTSFGSIIVRLVTLQPIKEEIAGPIGIARVTGQAIQFGPRAVLEFMSILSLNLAVLNILPIPALDGGRLMFVFAEKLMGRKVKPLFEQNAHQIGMIILLLLIVLVSINDILRLISG